MAMSSVDQPIRLAVMGLGDQGRKITKLSLDHGHDVVGAVARGDKIGRPLSDFVSHRRLAQSPARVHESFDALIDAVGPPDAVALCALLPVETTVDLAVSLLGRGINVLTIEAELFEGDDRLSARADAAGKAGGASMITSGMQDHSWVHLPAVAAAMNSAIQHVALNDFSNTGRFPKAVGEHEAALDFTRDQFGPWAAERLAAPPIQGGPLRSLARRLGCTPGEMKFEIEPITQDTPADWWEPGITIEPGRIVGSRFVTGFTTKEGPTFSATLLFQVKDRSEKSRNTIRISGETETVIDMPEFQNWLYVPMGLVRRIPDIVAAPPGVQPVEKLPPQRYTHTVN